MKRGKTSPKLISGPASGPGRKPSQEKIITAVKKWAMRPKEAAKKTTKPEPGKVTKEEVMTAIKKCATRLRRAPSFRELRERLKVSEKRVHQLFGNYSKALVECGLEPEGSGHKVSTDRLFADWAWVVRQLGKMPTIVEFGLRSGRSPHPLLSRFGSWRHVPAGMLEYAKESGAGKEWKDVLELARQHCLPPAAKKPCAETVMKGAKGKPRILGDRPVYGECFLPSAMAFAPENEMGVVSLFSALATKLGFVILWMGTAYPDCEAFRLVAPGKWQRVIIEFEFQSRNFLLHRHDPAKCDLIVCWEHNWPESPLEVLELKQAVSTQQSALSQS